MSLAISHLLLCFTMYVASYIHSMLMRVDVQRAGCTQYCSVHYSSLTAECKHVNGAGVEHHQDFKNVSIAAPQTAPVKHP